MADLDYDPSVLTSRGATSVRHQYEPSIPILTDGVSCSFPGHYGIWLAFVATYLTMIQTLVDFISLMSQSGTLATYETHLCFMI
ncbi:hypothetical protein L1887_28822 [Cichorium endivia]|nr:hypothetical protein L1887_28822 [Cichorium endivia]